MRQHYFGETWRAEVDVTQCQLPANEALRSSCSFYGRKSTFLRPHDLCTLFSQWVCQRYLSRLTRRVFNYRLIVRDARDLPSGCRFR